MHLSLNWIKKFVTLPEVQPERIALDLTMSTVEVEDVIDQAKTLAGIKVGQVKELVKHPEADRLSVCKVNLGNETVQIVCGGSNLREDMLVAVATLGSQVKWHGQGALVKLEKAKIRGQESHGMIVSAGEVGLETFFPPKDEHEIIDLSSYNFKVGQHLADALGLNDIILEIDNKSMTHRPDLWGQYGLAREIAAIYGTKLKALKYPPIPKASHKKKLNIKINSDKCRRYSAVVIDNVEVGPSPWWLKSSLEAVGLRSINNIVDVTNYVMMELGQPLHAFDYENIAEQQINIYELTKKEHFKTLDGQTQSLPVGALMIGDKNKLLAIAGIMGGANSEIKDNTNTIVLESANFAAASVRTTSMKLGLRSDASARFEKSLDPEMTVQALELAYSLIKKVSPQAVVASAIIDDYKNPPAIKIISVSKSQITRVMGIELDNKVIKDILTRLHFKVGLKKNIFEVTVPSYRATRDISIDEDIIEEIARIYGYNKIPASLPTITIEQPERDVSKILEEEIKNIISLSADYFEVKNYSFSDLVWTKALSLDQHVVEVKNYLTTDQRYLRTSLLPGLMKNVEDNLRWSNDFRLFEFGRVFENTKGSYNVDNKSAEFLPKQDRYFSGVSVSKEASLEKIYRQVKGLLTEIFNFYHIDFNFEPASDLPEETKTLFLRAHDQKFGSLGLLPSVLAEQFRGVKIVWWQINFSKLIKHADFSRLFSALPRYPSVVRDLSIVVNKKISWSEIEKEVAAASLLIEKVELFDIFQSANLGLDNRSLAFAIHFRSNDRTLSSGEIETVIKKIVAGLKKKFGAEQR